VLFTTYRTGLDAAILSQLPGPARQAVRESIMGAAQVAAGAGPAGDAIRGMAAGSYTHAMAILLVLSGISGIVAAIVGGLMIPHRRAQPKSASTPATRGAASEPA